MPNTWSTPLRPVVALIALLVVAVSGLVAPGPADAGPKTSVPVPAAVEVARAVEALRHLDPVLERRVQVLRAVERRLARRGRELAALDPAAPGHRATRAELRADRAALRADRRAARDRIAELRALRRDVLGALPLDLRQRAEHTAARAERRQARRAARADAASPLVELARAGAPPVVADPAPERIGLGAVALAYALTRIGTPYAAGGEAPGGFDCSGLVWWAYGRAGADIPRSSGDIYAAGERIAREDARPGDVVSFRGEGHVGIYVGGGLYVHSTETGDVVRVSPLADRTDLDGFVRLPV